MFACLLVLLSFLLSYLFDSLSFFLCLFAFWRSFA